MIHFGNSAPNKFLLVHCSWLLQMLPVNINIYNTTKVIDWWNMRHHVLPHVPPQFIMQSDIDSYWMHHSILLILLLLLLVYLNNLNKNNKRLITKGRYVWTLAESFSKAKPHSDYENGPAGIETSGNKPFFFANTIGYLVCKQFATTNSKCSNN